MSQSQSTENALIVAGGTANYATLASGVSEVHIISDGDCYISFNENVATTGSYLLKANLEAHPFVFLHGGPNKIWAITSGATVNVRILVIR